MKCEYGCGQEARFVLVNKKNCCSKSPNSCRMVKTKNSQALRIAYSEGRKDCEQFDGKRGWSKGLTKKIDIRVAKNGLAISKALIEKKSSSFILWNKNVPKESRKRQSETRKRLYLEGKINPPKGRGYNSYIIYKNKKILLRSTYEFIFTMYLIYKKIDFRYENIRVSFNNHTRINDFEINGKLYEIRGIPFSRDTEGREKKKAFENNGYKIRFLYWETIFLIQRYLERRNVGISDMIKKIKVCHKAKILFVFDCDSLLGYSGGEPNVG